MDNGENNQESSLKPWIIYLLIFGAIFMLLMAGKKKTENPNDISYDEFVGMVTDKVEGKDILIEAKIKFSQGSELKEISGKSWETRTSEDALVFRRSNGKRIEKPFQLKSTIPEEHETKIYGHPLIEQEQETVSAITMDMDQDLPTSRSISHHPQLLELKHSHH